MLRSPWSYASTSSAANRCCRQFHSSQVVLRRRNLYKVLDVQPNVKPKELKSAYYKLSLKYHPDMNKHADAAKKFHEISEAYEVLSNEDTRRTHDSEQFGFPQGSNAEPGSPADVIFKQRMAHSQARADKGHFHTDFDSSRMRDFDEFQRIFRTRQSHRRAANFDEWYKQHYGHAEWNEKMSSRTSEQAAENLFNQRRHEWIQYQLHNKRSKDAKYLAVVSGVSFAMILILGVIMNMTESSPGGYVYHDRKTGRQMPIGSLSDRDFPK